ncbi:MAG TPA: iron-sulfur cluster-binding domain-containing protein [Sphingobacteriaceae bacterium]
MDLPPLLQFRIVSVKSENPVAKTYELEETEGRTLEFLPGQFLTFIIHTEKQELRRSYSILSLPGEPLKVTVKKVVNGLISRFILQHWHVGDVVTALPPAGRFSLSPQVAISRDIFCFAAGSGIIPILPQLRSLLMVESQSHFILIYSNHNEAEALFLPEIAMLDEAYSTLDVIYLFSDPAYRHREQGHLSNLRTEALVARTLKYQKEDAIFLICGPFTYMRMLIYTLGLMHFPKENIRKENYLPESMRSGTISEPIFPDRQVLVKIREEVHTLEVRSGETLLKSALKNGLQPPYSCEGGVCGICAAKCRSGKVYMTINEVLTDNELSEGWVLTCTGYPAKDGTFIEY